MAKITRDSFNVDIRAKVGAVLDSGDTYRPTDSEKYQYGYGTALTQSSAVDQQKIDDSEWDNIRLDLIKARTHQKGVTWVSQNLGLQSDIPGGANNTFDVAAGEDITTAIYNKYTSVANDTITDKFLVGAGEFDRVSAASPTQTNITFDNNASWTFTATWDSASLANKFFNSGGAIYLNFSVTTNTSGGNTGEKRRQSDDMRDNIQSLQGGSSSYVEWGASQWYNSSYNSTTYVEWLSDGGSGAYSDNEAILQVSKDNAGLGTARTMRFKLQLNSDYEGGGLSGTGAGAIFYGDNIQLTITPNVEIRTSKNTIIGPSPSSVSYGSWSSS